MGFTTSCFIRKNTEELRKKLEELGYTLIPNGYAEWNIPTKECIYLFCDVEVYQESLISFYMGRMCKPYGFYCGENEALFLAIAALRDDSNYMQWFITDSPLSVSYDDSIGNDHYFTEPKGSMFFWDENWNHATIISGSYHKATVEELINHFK